LKTQPKQDLGSLLLTFTFPAGVKLHFGLIYFYFYSNIILLSIVNKETALLTEEMELGDNVYHSFTRSHQRLVLNPWTLGFWLTWVSMIDQEKSSQTKRLGLNYVRNKKERWVTLSIGGIHLCINFSALNEMKLYE